jgi:glutamate formiminotransferase
MTDQQARFLERAQQSLSNKSEVSESLAIRALSEAVIEVGDISEHQLFDVAMIRLKITLKSEVSEVDWALFKNAKATANRIQAQTAGGNHSVTQRTSAWDI